MVRYSLAFFCLLICLSCNQSSETITHPSALIPEDAQAVLYTTQLSQINEMVKTNEFISGIWQEQVKSDSTNFWNITNEIPSLEHVFLTEIRETQLLLAKKNTNDSLPLNELPNHASYDSVLHFSSRPLDLTPVSEGGFDDYIKTVKGSSHLLLNEKPSQQLYRLFYNDSIAVAASQAYLKLQALPEQIQLHGILRAKDSQSGITGIYKKTIPEKLSLSTVSPSSATVLINYKVPEYGWMNYLKNGAIASDSMVLHTDLLNTLREVGVVVSDDKSVFFAAKSVDIGTTKDALNPYILNETIYKSEAIFELDTIEELQDLQQVFSLNFRANYGVILEDYVIFGGSTALLEGIITSFKNKNTLANDLSYQKIEESLSTSSHLVLYAKDERLNDYLNPFFGSNTIDLNGMNHGAVQVIQDDDFQHLNIVLSKAYKSNSRNEVTQDFAVTLDNDILGKPQFVKNHRTNQKEIVVQDVDNRLYLISNAGKILWKKRLSGPILGDIEQVDLYKNGRLQLTFVTEDKWYVIDRNGNDVLPFPRSFADKITQPLAVFDYDKTRKYRFLIVQDDELLIYDGSGKFVRGFNYAKSGVITSQPKHIRHRSKDYIVFVAGNQLQILNRRGKVRIKATKTFEHSGNPVFFYNNRFSTTDNAGSLIQFDLYGSATTSSVASVNAHKIDATSKTLVVQQENLLTIKEKEIALDFGSYTSPQIFYLNNKIYIAVTDLQTQKLYLFDSQAKPIDNFPVYGQSAIDMDNIDADNALEIVTTGSSNEIILYEKN